MPWPLYRRGKRPRYPLDRRLSGPQSRSGRRGEEKILDPTGTRTPTPRSSSPVARRYTDYAIPASMIKLREVLFKTLRTCSTVWVWNLVSDIEGVWEQGAEENNWIGEGWNNRRLRKPHTEDLHSLYSSPNMIWMIKSWRRRTGHVVRIGKNRSALECFGTKTWRQETSAKT
jgi:hypothetical protein